MAMCTGPAAITTTKQDDLIRIPNFGGQIGCISDWEREPTPPEARRGSRTADLQPMSARGITPWAGNLPRGPRQKSPAREYLNVTVTTPSPRAAAPGRLPASALRTAHFALGSPWVGASRVDGRVCPAVDRALAAVAGRGPNPQIPEIRVTQKTDALGMVNPSPQADPNAGPASTIAITKCCLSGDPSGI